MPQGLLSMSVQFTYTAPTRWPTVKAWLQPRHLRLKNRKPCWEFGGLPPSDKADMSLLTRRRGVLERQQFARFALLRMAFLGHLCFKGSKQGRVCQFRYDSVLLKYIRFRCLWLTPFRDDVLGHDWTL